MTIAATTPEEMPVDRRGYLRGLIWTLIRTDFKTRYHGTIGGFVWALLKPSLMFAVLLGVFSYIFASEPRYKFDLIIGLFLWDFFAEGTKSGLRSLHSKSFLLTKAKFPTWVIVLTSMSNPLITLAVFSVVIFGFLAAFGFIPSLLQVALFFFYLAMYVLIVCGFSLGASVLFLRYRDLNEVWEVVLQAGFFVAPIIFPLDILPERFHILLYMWLPTPIIQFSREVLVMGTIPSARAHGLLALEASVILAVGGWLFWRHSKRAIQEL